MQVLVGVSPAAAWRLEHGHAQRRDELELEAARVRHRLSGVVGAFEPEWSPVAEVLRPDGIRYRQRLEAVRLGEAVVVLGGRALPADWQEEVSGSSGAMWREALGGCSSAYVVGLTGGRLATAPVKCGKAWCPTCQRWAAGQRVKRWGPLLQRLLLEGFRVETWTLTRPNTGASETADTTLPAWHRGAVGYCRPVAGESLVETEDAIRAGFRALREADRELWRHVAGYLYGMESTGRTAGRRRWHTHLHVLVVYPPGEPSIWPEVSERWCGLMGGVMAAQHCEDMTGSDRVSQAVMEVLKYPFKSGDLNAAQWAEVIAARGIRHHQAGGIFHGTTTYGATMRGKPWCRPEPEPRWLRLARDAWLGQEPPPAWRQVMVLAARQRQGLVDSLVTHREPDEDASVSALEWEPLSWARVLREAEAHPDAYPVLDTNLRNPTWGALKRALSLANSVEIDEPD